MLSAHRDTTQTLGTIFLIDGISLIITFLTTVKGNHHYKYRKKQGTYYKVIFLFLHFNESLER